jgi:hypothetical protein
MKVIALTGRKQHGKDTVCNLIAVLLPELKVQRLAFADPLKEEVAAALGISVEEINADKERFRMILQWWGTEWRRKQCLTYWIDKMRERLCWCREIGVDVAVLTDCRFLNESELVYEVGGSVWMVHRPLVDDTNTTHTSETEGALIRVKHTLYNRRDVEFLRDQVKGALVTEGLISPLLNRWTEVPL